VAPVAATTPSAEGLDVRVSKPLPLHAVVLPMTGSYARHAEALARLAAYLGSVGLEPAGAPFGRYHNDPRAVAESELVWELGFPMAQPAAVSAPFEARTLDDALVATLVVPGPHEASRPWDAFGRWIVDHGYTPEGPAMETWLDGPRTEMRLAVRK
jgi:effector-binding domain-containing protein